MVFTVLNLIFSFVLVEFLMLLFFVMVCGKGEWVLVIFYFGMGRI